MASAVYQVVTDRVIGLLERGVCPWRRPWKSDGTAGATDPQNVVSRRAYRGINSLLLGSLGFDSPCFLTFHQARELGGSVRKGEHGFPVVFWKQLDIEEEDSQGGKARKRIPMLRYFTVFNVRQCDGLKDIPLPVVRPIVPAESVFPSYVAGPSIYHGGDRACYSPAEDRVTMPSEEAFTSRDFYFSTLYHELTHSTGHASRLARFSGPDQFLFGSSSYGREELVAEMGAAFLSAEAGIDVETPSASYLASWLRALKQPGNVKLVIEAAGKAARGVDLILGRTAPAAEGGAS